MLRIMSNGRSTRSRDLMLCQFQSISRSANNEHEWSLQYTLQSRPPMPYILSQIGMTPAHGWHYNIKKWSLHPQKLQQRMYGIPSLHSTTASDKDGLHAAAKADSKFDTPAVSHTAAVHLNWHPCCIGAPCVAGKAMMLH